MRSKVNYYEQGEKSNKFFLNLEKSTATKKLISKLAMDDKGDITSSKEILEEEVTFYKNIFANKIEENEETTFKRKTIMSTPQRKLTYLQKQELLKPITEEEIYNIIKVKTKAQEQMV